MQLTDVADPGDEDSKIVIGICAMDKKVTLQFGRGHHFDSGEIEANGRNRHSTRTSRRIYDFHLWRRGHSFFISHFSIFGTLDHSEPSGRRMAKMRLSFFLAFGSVPFGQSGGLRLYTQTIRH